MYNPFRFHESDERTDDLCGYETEQEQRKDIDAESKSFAWFVSAAIIIIALLLLITVS